MKSRDDTIVVYYADVEVFIIAEPDTGFCLGICGSEAELWPCFGLKEVMPRSGILHCVQGEKGTLDSGRLGVFSGRYGMFPEWQLKGTLSLSVKGAGWFRVSVQTA